jgi:hypothetical protein
MSYKLEKTEIGQDIVIQGWNEGVQDNPYEGIYDMRNCDAVTIPGEFSVAMATQVMNTQQGAITNLSYTVDPVTNVFTYNGVVPLQVGTAITFTNSGGGLPAPLVANTGYYIVSLYGSTGFNISATYGGNIIDITTAGTGTNTFSTVNMGTINYFADSLIQGFERIYFALDNAGRAWCTYSANNPNQPQTWIYMNNPQDSTGFGNGLVAYKGYLFVFKEIGIDVINFNSGGNFSGYTYITNNSNWIYNWQNMRTIVNAIFSAVSHYALVSVNDDSVYFCDLDAVGIIAYDTSATDNPNQTPFNIALGRNKSDGVTNSTTTLTSATMNFTQADVGAYITGTTIPANTYIVSVTNSTTVILSRTTSASTGITITIPQTYIYNPAIVLINSNDIANCLGELGSNLEIGGINNYIYPWDRVSPNFSTPIFLSEYRVSRLVTVNTTMYIFCGFKGRIFVTNGANATPFYKVPDYLSGTTNPYYFWTDAAFSRNQIYFGFQVTDNAGTTISTMGGLWSIDVDSSTPTSPRLNNIMSYGTYAGYVNAIHVWRKVGLTQLPSADGYGILSGWYDGVLASGIDIGISTPYLAGQSFIDTDPVPIGQYLTSKTLAGIEYKLGQPLANGESIAIGFRTKLSGSYTDNPITDLSDVSGWGVPVFEKSQWVQFRITPTAVNGGSNCRVREIRIHLT